MRLLKVMQRQENYLQEHYNQSRPVPGQEERYNHKQEQYASEPSSTLGQAGTQSHPYSTQQPVKMENSSEPAPDSLSGNIYNDNRKSYPNEAREMISYSHQEAVSQSQQSQPIGLIYKNQPSRPSPQMVQPQQPVISSTQSTQSNMPNSNLFYENTVSKDSEIQLSVKDRQTLMNDRNNPNAVNIISVEEVVSTEEVVSNMNLNQAEASDVSERPISSDKTHVCMTCFKAFKNKPQLTQHELVHNGIRKHVCSYCDKSFKQLCHLNQHTRTHTGERPYKCMMEGCGRSFAQLSNLHHHQKNHDEHIKRDISRQFRCAICDRSYANESSLRTHTLKLHMNLKQGDSGQLAEAPPVKKRKKKKGTEAPTLSVVNISSDEEGPPTQVRGQLNPSMPQNQISSSVPSLNQPPGGLNQPRNLTLSNIDPNDPISKILLKRLMGGENQDILLKERSTPSQPLHSPPFQAADSSSRQVQNVVSPFQPLPKVSTLAHPIPVSLQQQDRAVFTHESFNPERVPQNRTVQQKEDTHVKYM